MHVPQYERAILIQVSGRVQGVGFRFFTHQQAKKLNLVGYVKNLDNGDVQIIACGLNGDVEKLLSWLAKGGPTSAQIESYDIKKITLNEHYISFSVRY